VKDPKDNLVGQERAALSPGKDQARFAAWAVVLPEKGQVRFAAWAVDSPLARRRMIPAQQSRL